MLKEGEGLNWIGHDVYKTLNQYRHGEHLLAREQGFDQEMHFTEASLNMDIDSIHDKLKLKINFSKI